MRTAHLSPQWTRSLFFGGIILCASGYISPPVALLLGLTFGLTVIHPLAGEVRGFIKVLLQASVVLLGFAMNLQQVVRAGASGFLYTAIGITFALLLGTALGMLFKVRGVPSFLISAGTAICGGSAIAAVGPVVQANEEEMAVALGTVFVLNSVALLIFPAIGAALHMSQSQFGLWAALAIHDTSSVVGACAKYGADALTVGTTVKLARALWIVPLTLAAAAVMRRRSSGKGHAVAAKIQWPWFIAFFVLAAVVNTFLRFDFDFDLHGVAIPLKSAPLYLALARLGRLGLTVTLFLIGTGISRATIKKVGAGPMLQGILLWLVVGLVSLEAIHAGWIHI